MIEDSGEAAADRREEELGVALHRWGIARRLQIAGPKNGAIGCSLVVMQVRIGGNKYAWTAALENTVNEQEDFMIGCYYVYRDVTATYTAILAIATTRYRMRKTIRYLHWLKKSFLN